MASQEHLDILNQGVETWNSWRREHPKTQSDLSGAYLSGANLSYANLDHANLVQAYLDGANLSYANLDYASLESARIIQATLTKANLSHAYLANANLWVANLSYANLRNADLSRANLIFANLSHADLFGALLIDADLYRATLIGAYLSHAHLDRAKLIETNFSKATLTDCHVYGISAWSVQLEGTKQENLVITPDTEPTITVDNLKVAQFIHLLLNNAEIRDVIDTITSKVVLILGRFTPERKAILDALRDELRKHNYLPVLFDFEKPVSRDFTETISTLAHLARFIIADITEPSSIPQELREIVPGLEVPVQPILEDGKREYAMFPDLSKYPWVFPVYHYKNQVSLIASLKKEILEPADQKARKLTTEKAKRLEKQ